MTAPAVDRSHVLHTGATPAATATITSEFLSHRDWKARWPRGTRHRKATDSTFRFEVEPLDGGRCRLRFTQLCAVGLDDYFGVFNFEWGYYLQSSLELVTTGKGKP